LPRDLLAPHLPTRDHGIRPGELEQPVISHIDTDALDRHDEEPLLELPPARPRWSEARSDIHQLLAAFLVETRSVEQMLRALRDMIGLELRPRDVPGDSASITPVPR
jgi:hypothetical protein